MKSMNKILVLFLALWITVFGLSQNGITGLPPTAIKGLFDSVFTTAFNFIVPNKLATKTSRGVLIESGNKNLLANPSFETTNATDSWTMSPPPSLLELSDVQDGKQSLVFSPAAQAFEVSQDSTINQAGFTDGVQGLAMVRVKVSAATNLDIQVCPRRAGAIVSSLCLSVARNGQWGTYKIPFVLGATSNGISINSAGYANVTGTIQIDDAFVGVADVRQDTDQSRIAGSISLLTGFTRTSTSLGAFTGSIAPTTLITPTMGTWSTAASSGISQVITNLPAGCYRHEWQLTISGSTASAAESVCATVNGVCDNSAYAGYIQPSTLHHAMTVTGLKCFDSTQASVDFSLYGAASAGSISNNSSWPTNFKLTYYQKGSVYTSTCGTNCVDVFVAKVSSGGGVTEENVDWINGNASVTDTSIFNITFNTGIFPTTAPTCSMSPISVWGVDTKQANPETAPTTSGIAVRTQLQNGSTAVKAAYPFLLICVKSGADFNASRTIVGSFKDVVTSQGSNTADIQSVYFGSSADCTTACTTGNCTICNQVGGKITSVSFAATGIYRVNGIDGTKYNCTVGALAPSVFSAIGIHSRPLSTSTYAQIQTYNSGTAAAANVGYASVTCMGIP